MKQPEIPPVVGEQNPPALCRKKWLLVITGGSPAELSRRRDDVAVFPKKRYDANRDVVIEVQRSHPVVRQARLASIRASMMA
jgi:hypothetical protein